MSTLSRRLGPLTLAAALAAAAAGPATAEQPGASQVATQTLDINDFVEDKRTQGYPATLKAASESSKSGQRATIAVFSENEQLIERSKDVVAGLVRSGYNEVMLVVGDKNPNKDKDLVAIFSDGKPVGIVVDHGHSFERNLDQTSRTIIDKNIRGNLTAYAAPQSP